MLPKHSRSNPGKPYLSPLGSLTEPSVAPIGRVLDPQPDPMLGTPRFGHSIARVALLFAVVGGALLGASESAEASLDDPIVPIPSAMRGLSGKLRMKIVPPPADTFAAPEPVAFLFGAEAARRPDVWMVRDSITKQPFAFLTLVRFNEKRNGRVGAYNVGRWPGEVREPRSEAYGLPAGFIEVTEQNADLQISENFRLRDFLDRNQPNVWPKALVLEERLVDKLELVTTELRRTGNARAKLLVMSGFRTPVTTAGGARSRRSPDSRHQYGDAADVIVDGNGDGQMDDLNADGRVDVRDTRILINAIQAVEARYPELVGGIGMYRSGSVRGPFVHVDARGTSVRWGLP